MTAVAQNVTTATTTQDIYEAVGQATEPTTIRLQAGVYAPITLQQSSVPVRIEAADSANPPRLTGLLIADSSDVAFANVVFDFEFEPGVSGLWDRPFRFSNSRRLSFDNILVDGATLQGTGTDGDGYPAGRGLEFVGTQDVTIMNSEIRGFWVGLTVRESQGFNLQNTHLHGIRKDIITLAAVKDVLIASNYFGDFNQSSSFDDHPDMIQLWTRDTTTRSERITIRNNIFNSGMGLWSQTIFLRNDEVDKGNAGNELYYRDITIEQNVIINAHVNALFVGETAGLIIRNNTLIANLRSREDGMSETLSSPSIRVANASQDVVIERNIAHNFPNTTGTGWINRDNFRVQAFRRGEEGYYERVFANAINGDPRNLSSFYYTADGPLYGSGIGADILDTAP